MCRWFWGFCLVVAVAIPASGQTQYPIFTEDFESGLDAWTVLAYDPTGGVNNNTPLVFDSTGAGIYGANIGYPGSQSVGFSSNLAPWDGQQPQWIEIQWPGLLEPGIYDVVIVVDRYVYFDGDDPPNGPGDEDPWGVGNRVYVLTDSKYDNPVMNYDGDMGIDGVRWSKWSNKGEGIWEIGAINRGQDIETTTGNVELRLLFHEKYAHYNTVAWDNLTLTLRRPGGSVVFTYPAGTAGTLTTRTDADNGVVTLGAGHGLQPNDMVDVSWAGPAGSGGIRRMKVSSVSENEVTVWAAVGAADALPAQGTAVVVNKPEDFEDGLAGWTTKLYGPKPNDTPILFSATDPLLYDNVDNPGSQSAGFSSNMAEMDFTAAAWMQQQFPAAVPAGETYVATFEYDCYVYKEPGDPWGVGNRMYVLTDDQYNQPLWDFDNGDRGNGFSVDYWPGWLNNTVDWSLNGHWQHVVTQQTISTTTGNIEVRLLQHDKHPGPQAVAWDNLSLTLTRVPPPCGDNRFDRDGDGDVDQADFAALQMCFTGDGDPAFLFDAGACFCFDTNNDLDVDQTDLLAFENCASGPGVAADQACDDSLPPPVVPD